MEKGKMPKMTLASCVFNIVLSSLLSYFGYDQLVPKQFVVLRDPQVRSMVSYDLKKEAEKVGDVVEQVEGLDAYVVEASKFSISSKELAPGMVVEPMVKYSRPKPLGCARDPELTQPPPLPDPNQPVQKVDWGVARVNAVEAQRVIDGHTVKVCVLDTGIDQNHPDLRFVKGKNFTSTAAADFQDRDGHGTHTAGLVAAVNNGIGVVGASQAQLYVGKVLGDDGSGYNSWIAAGINWCVTEKVDIISMSLGGPSKSKVLESALLKASAAGIEVFAAAGNDGESSVGYPAGYEIDGLYSIAAIDYRDEMADFSNYGKIEFACPGVNILSTTPGGKYQAWDGTSMATPICAGVGAIFRAAGKPIEAEYIGDEYGDGVPNALKAVK